MPCAPSGLCLPVSADIIVSPGSAVQCGPLFRPATHSAALFVSPRRLFFSVNELLLRCLCMYLFFPPLCPEPSSAEPPLSTFTLFSYFFVFAIKDTSTGIFWCSTGLPSLFFLSWFNLKSELCSPLYLISSLPVSPLSRSVLSLSVGVQYNDWWMQKTLFFGQSAVTHWKAREQERCAWPFTLWDLMLVGMWGGRGGLWVTGLWRLWCKCTHAK